MKKLIYISIILFCFQSCKQNSAQNSSPVAETILQEKQTADAKIQIQENTTFNRDSVNAFLDKPFDLYEFKKLKGRSNSGSAKKENYYFKPNKKGKYYRYFLFTIRNDKNKIRHNESGVEIMVYKELGEYQHKFIDPTEQLIEVRERFNDFDLPELALIGLDIETIIKKFGEADFTKNNCIAYTHNNKVLILNVVNKKVRWLKYIHLKEGVNHAKNERLFEI